jgi:peptidyl-prolyl cis-trans isomerase C
LKKESAGQGRENKGALQKSSFAAYCPCVRMIEPGAILRIFLIGSFLLPVVFCLILSSCIERREFSPPEQAEAVVARVGGSVLSKKEFESMLPEDYQDLLTADEKREYLDRWINTELLYREALNEGLGDSPEINAKLEAYKKDLVADRLVQKILQDRAVVSEDEVKAYFKEHEREYNHEFRVSHILLNTLEDAETVKEKLKNNSFYWTAKKYSIDKHSHRGGDLGFLSKGNMIPEFENVVFKMKVGEVSDIIESEFGYHIIKLTDIRPSPHKLIFDDVKDEVANSLLMQKRTATYDSLVSSLRSRSDINILDDELNVENAWEEEDTVADDK